MLRGKGDGILVMVYVVGYMFGGVVWKIGKDVEDVVYVVDYNVWKERYLNGIFFDVIYRFAFFIIDASSVDCEVLNKIIWDVKLIDLILFSLCMNGNVFILIDFVGCVFELILLLEEKWA